MVVRIQTPPSNAEQAKICIKRDKTDNEILDETRVLLLEDKLLTALQVVQNVKDETLIDDEMKNHLYLAQLNKTSRDELLVDPLDKESGWKKQGESHGRYNFLIYYKIGEKGNVKIRIDTPIDKTLFAPFLAVINETELYNTWIPKWNAPFKFGVHTNKLQQNSRLDQIVEMIVDIPWPFKKRKAIVHGSGFVNIDNNPKECGLKLKSINIDNNNEYYEGITITNDDNDDHHADACKYFDLDSALLYRRCPPNHRALKRMKGSSISKDHMVLISFVVCVDPKLAFVPLAFLNFCARTVMGTIWKMVLRVAEEIRDGKRPKHAELIESKRDELYNFVDEIVDNMCK